MDCSHCGIIILSFLDPYNYKLKRRQDDEKWLGENSETAFLQRTLWRKNDRLVHRSRSSDSPISHDFSQLCILGTRHQPLQYCCIDTISGVYLSWFSTINIFIGTMWRFLNHFTNYLKFVHNQIFPRITREQHSRQNRLLPECYAVFLTLNGQNLS